MRYLVTAQEMKQYDKNTIEYLGIPGPVLMERAALAAEDLLKERFDAVKERTKVLIFAGMGNNGGDGLALARLLAADGYTVAVRLVGDPAKSTEQWKGQWQTLQHFPVKTDSNTQTDEYNVIVDALFGVGLSRPVEGIYQDAVEEMNAGKGFKVALDVPSGICSDTGRVLGCAFHADATKQEVILSGAEGVTTKHIDVIFPVLHGMYGEDGTIQGLFEMSKIPYVGCGVLASAVGMDKVYTKIIVDELGIQQADYVLVRAVEVERANAGNANVTMDDLADRVEEKLNYPVFIKPSKAGSSQGVSKAHNREELGAGLELAAKHDTKILVERNIIGREIECAVLGSAADVEASGVGEILAAAEFYDFDAKYTNAESKTVISPSLRPSEPA